MRHGAEDARSFYKESVKVQDNKVRGHNIGVTWREEYKYEGLNVMEQHREHG